MFHHDPETNVLRLRREDEGYPWIAGAGEWLYCTDCFDRYISTSDRSRVHHVPLRDKVSRMRVCTSHCFWLSCSVRTGVAGEREALVESAQAATRSH